MLTETTTAFHFHLTESTTALHIHLMLPRKCFFFLGKCIIIGSVPKMKHI